MSCCRRVVQLCRDCLLIVYQFAAEAKTAGSSSMLNQGMKPEDADVRYVYLGRVWQLTTDGWEHCISFAPVTRSFHFSDHTASHIMVIDSDEGLTHETSAIESFAVASLLYRPCG